MSAGASLQSPDWYRVARLRPRLRAGVRVTRQRLRGETWQVLTDPVTGRHHRFNDGAFAIVARCDGRATLDEIWTARVEADGERAPTQAETIRILAQAFAANLFVGDIAPDAAALLRTRGRQRAARRRSQLNPLAFRVPLADPDPWLARVAPAFAWLASAPARAAFALILACGALLLLANLGDLLHHAQGGLTEGRMLLLMWLVFPPLKALHEFAHALAVKRRGGEVHEAGITLMMLTPVPYVDASASAAFADKRDRMAVALAGIRVEAVLASLALPMWLLLEPGWGRDLAFAVVFIGALSTLLVNGNPLLRFDGYYALTDWAEVPNLAARSQQWWQHLLKRRLLAVGLAQPPVICAGELPWLATYAPLSWLWRTLLMLGVAVLAAQWNGALGLMLLAWVLWASLGKPVVGVLRWLTAAEESRGRRLRGAAVLVATVVITLSAAIAVPLPQRTQAAAVVWLPDDALLRLDSDGFLEQIMVADGAKVRAGTPVARLSNDALQVRLAALEAESARLRVERIQWFETDAARAAAADDELARVTAERQRAQARVDALTVRAAVDGRLVLDPRHRVIGRHVPQGEAIAYVLPDSAPLVRVLVQADDIDLVRERALAVRVRLAHAPEVAHAAVVQAEVPRAGTALPTAALGESAGGSIALDPADTSGRTAREPHFQLDLRLPPGSVAPIGARALVTFDHGASSAAALAARALRQAFLRHFER